MAATYTAAQGDTSRVIGYEPDVHDELEANRWLTERGDRGPPPAAAGIGRRYSLAAPAADMTSLMYGKVHVIPHPQS